MESLKLSRGTLKIMIKVYIVLRRTINWNTISYDAFRKQSREFAISLGRPVEQINMSVDLWNRTFNRSFFDVRQEIKELTLKNFSTISNVEIIEGNELTDLNSEALNEGFYILIDDDDWLHPQISDFLSTIKIDDKRGGIIWGSVLFGGVNERIITYRSIDGYCYTNNCVVFGSLLKSDPAMYKNIREHGRASLVLGEKNAPIINEYWSITNKHPISTNYMNQFLKENYHSELLVKSVENYIQRCQKIDIEIDPLSGWARPLMHEMGEIFSKLI